ncbi:MAG: tryptophan--tRNA ligase [Acidimicrobiia bacterium]
MTRPISLTGIKPTGTPHLGNLVGAIRPALGLAERYDAYYFIADEHALTTIRDAEEMRRYSFEVTATWLACGLDPERTVVYKQSAVPEVFELHWIISCLTAKGLMNRAHAYKAAVDAATARGDDPDADVNMGLYNYPVLMAADILVMRANVVPVGPDQIQHLEMTRDIAQRFNHTFGEVLTVPEAVVEAAVGIPGTDGRKMSKSYDNTIPLFEAPKAQRKRIMRITTDSTPMGEPLDPDGSAVYPLIAAFASADVADDVKARMVAGEASWGELKGLLADLVDAALEGPRARYEELCAHPDEVTEVLAEGARKARVTSERLIADVKAATGLI